MIVSRLGSEPTILGRVVFFAALLGVTAQLNEVRADPIDCTPNTPCENQDDARPEPVSQELIARRLIEQAHNDAEMIRHLTATRLIGGPALSTSLAGPSLVSGFAGAGANGTQTEDLLQSFLTTNSGPAPLWNAWLDGSLTYFDRNGPAGYNGPLATLSVGIDRTINDALIVGLFGSIERSDYELVPSTSDLETDSIGIGAYAGLAVTDWLVADGLIQWQSSSNDYTTAASSASYNSQTIILSGNLTGFHFIDTVRLSPMLGVNWSQEQEDAYTDSLGFAFSSRTTETAVLEFGGEVGNTFFVGEDTTLEPWLGLAGEWAFQDTSPSPLDPFDVRVSGGLNANFGDQFALVVSGNVAGLALGDYITATGGIQASLRF